MKNNKKNISHIGDIYDKFGYSKVEKIINFYEKGTNNFVLHFIYWIIFFLIFTINTKASFALSFFEASLFGIRNTLICIYPFYMIFNLILPFIFIKKRYLIAGILSLSIFWFGAIVNYLDMKIAMKFVNLKNTNLYFPVKKIAEQKFSEIVSFVNVLQLSLSILLIITAPILIKLIFDFFLMLNRALRLEKEKLVLELNFLKSQLNPHFLFNALNNIYSLSYKKDEKATDMILQLSDLMRYTLYETNAEWVPLEREIAFLKNYVALEKVRYNKQTNIEFITEYKETDIKKINVAPLIFFNFVENAFKHGINSIAYNAWVKIFIAIKNKNLLLKVSNSYNGIAMERVTMNKKVGGIGIENTIKRLSLLYPGEYNLDIAKTKSTYEISLSINLA